MKPQGDEIPPALQNQHFLLTSPTFLAFQIGVNTGKARLLCATISAAVALSQGCVPLMAQGFANNKTPPAQTAESCQSWECWDGYKCGECEADAKSSDKTKTK